MVDLVQLNDVEEVQEKTADTIADWIDSVIKEKGKVLLAVPGGRSVAGVFSQLARKNLDWKRIHLFMVDERLVPFGSKDCNYNILESNLINEIDIPQENVHPFVYTPDIVGLGTVEYAEQISAQGGRFDIVLLSSGEDGHIGALYPNHHSMSDNSETLILMDDSPKPPPDRMSISRSLLSKAKYAVILFVGESKKDALHMFGRGPFSPEECPARLLYQISNVYAFTDQR